MAEVGAVDMASTPEILTLTISERAKAKPTPSRTKKTGFWRIAASTKDQPLLVLKPTGTERSIRTGSPGS
jgi:hypothetical protein